LRIVRGSRFPPAGEKVLRRTRVRRGAAARRIGCFYLFVSTPLLALAIWGGFQAHSLSPKMQPCPLVSGCPWPTSCKLPNMQLTLEIEREENGR
jgi:hypothetical protein